MGITILDVEASGAQRNKAHPFDERNKLVYAGCKEYEGSEELLPIEYADRPYGNSLRKLQEWASNSRLLVGANIKYDLHWLHRYGIDTSSSRIFDVSIAFFILRGQTKAYPSLDEMAEYYGVEKKLDVVKTEYWNKGIDTDEIPENILTEYLSQDLRTTEQVFKKISEEMQQCSQEMQTTIKLAMDDCIVLGECESNGMLYDKDASLAIGDSIAVELEESEERLKVLSGFPEFNSSSYQHKSVVLFGGKLEVKARVQYPYTYKDGTTTMKEKWGKEAIEFPGMFSSALSKPLAEEGFYSTDAAILENLLPKARGEAKEFVSTLLKIAKQEKRRGTYFHGFPKQIEKYNWLDNVIHTSLNQTVAATGRLSSSKPNVQNIEEKVKEMFISRFNNVV